ncbi:hypothetical protein [Bradyrhizobium sp. WSM1743]|uniref:hypothetical protein n=1 Tax=Bradyrhizobium sp. WSM1743 TaxID=318996 RepID=UPI0012EB2858|nr:hypothetical protein [Bradyrhizobium sp. WSM1743]
MAPRRPGNDDAAASLPVNRARDEVQVAPPSVVEGKSEQTIGTAPVDASADVVQVTSPLVVERKGEQTIGTAPLDVPAADVVQVIPPRIIEDNDAPITGSNNGLSLVMMMALVALGIITFLPFRHRYAERVLAFAAMRCSEARADDARPISLRCPPQIEAGPAPLSTLEASVQNVLDTIKEAEAEMVSSRQLRKPV